MIQRLIQMLVDSLRRSHMADEDSKYSAVEIATHLVNQLDLLEVGYLCWDEHTMYPIPGCDECYPIYRIRGLED